MVLLLFDIEQITLPFWASLFLQVNYLMGD